MSMLLRVYAIVCALVFMPLAPVFFIDAGSERHHPIELAAARRNPDGSMLAGAPPRTIVVTRVKIGDGPWLSAASSAVGRQLRNLPAGTSVAYETQRGIINGTIDRRPLPVAKTVSRYVLALLAVIFLSCGLGLVMAGRNRPAWLAAGFLSGAGAALAYQFLEPNVIRVHDAALRNGLIAIVVAIPATLWTYFLAELCAEFPHRLWRGPVFRTGSVLLFACAMVNAALAAWAQLPSLFDRIPWPVQLSVMRILEAGTLQNVQYLLLIVLAGTTTFRQRRTTGGLSRDLDKRARVVYTGMALALGPALVGIAIQLAGKATVGRLVLPPLLMSLALLPLAVIPITITYALLGRRVESPGLLARRAVMFTVARRMTRAIAASPFLVIVALFYLHRGQSVASVAHDHAVTIGISTGIGIVALHIAPRLEAWLEGAFSRERYDARLVLHRALDRLRLSKSIDEAAPALLQELDRALHLESLALFVRHEDRFAPAGDALPELDAHAELAAILAANHQPLEITTHILDALPENEVQWLAVRDFRLVVPLFQLDDTLLAVLALSEKLSELPFTEDDRALLRLVANSASAVIENVVHRQPPRSVNRNQESDDEIALICPACHTLFPPLGHPRCPNDDTPLTRSEVPHLLEGKLRFEKQVGAGAISMVYRARDLSLGRTVAIKTLPRSSRNEIALLRREARLAARILHPNIATLFAAETWRGMPMLVMEFLDGGTLADRIVAGRLPESEIVRLGRALCAALAEAHGHGILHRDIKPSNIAFQSVGWNPKIVDFGLARFIEEHAASSQRAATDGAWPRSSSVGLAGTPLYLSPEALTGTTPDERFDLWALAMTLYEAFTGAHPFTDVTSVRVMNRILSQPIPDLRDVRRDASPRLVAFFAKALHHQSAHRPQSALEFLELLT